LLWNVMHVQDDNEHASSTIRVEMVQG